ncbi:MAG: hypothetical protein AMJ77_05420 [Dehalococcoidia bacterium SM23_28_2]|nr:MAG: hypothetical protein AMJ77_05420 [Dehalococcoidia bacterium SM23_28_2]
MVDAGAGVGVGRALVEDEQPVLRPLVDALAEDVPLLPQTEDALLHLGEAHPATDGLEHRHHLPSILKARPRRDGPLCLACPRYHPCSPTVSGRSLRARPDVSGLCPCPW